MNEITIGIIVAIVAAVMLGIKGWIHRALTFKMDESAILNVLKASRAEFKILSTDAITVETGISKTRVAMVCTKSKSIQRNAKEEASWCLK
jgi:hypothetical protein